MIEQHLKRVARKLRLEFDEPIYRCGDQLIPLSLLKTTDTNARRIA